MLRTILISTLILVQVVCAFFFVGDILSSVFGLRSEPISWRARELIEIGAAAGLILGVVLGAIMLAWTLRAQRRAEARLELASVAFMDMVDGKFGDWGLTPAERDVALFSVKGFSLAEIAGLRGVSEGTIKAQTNAIYRKAGVSGRAQLLAVLIEEVVVLPKGVIGLVDDASNGAEPNPAIGARKSG